MNKNTLCTQVCNFKLYSKVTPSIMITVFNLYLNALSNGLYTSPDIQAFLWSGISTIRITGVKNGELKQSDSDGRSRLRP